MKMDVISQRENDKAFLWEIGWHLTVSRFSPEFWSILDSTLFYLTDKFSSAPLGPLDPQSHMNKTLRYLQMTLRREIRKCPRAANVESTWTWLLLQSITSRELEQPLWVLMGMTHISTAKHCVVWVVLGKNKVHWFFLVSKLIFTNQLSPASFKKKDFREKSFSVPRSVTMATCNSRYEIWPRYCYFKKINSPEISPDKKVGESRWAESFSR